MDFGKYKYTQARRLKEARKKQTTIQVKEVKMGPKTESALRSFQQQQKLEATGKIDQETLAALGLNDLTQSTTGQGRGQQHPVSAQQERKQ